MATQKSDLFPISHEAYAEAIGTFSGLTDEELRLVEAANDTLLPDNNPTHFALQLNMRPDLRMGDSEQDELQRHAYRVGVLLGRRVIKNSIDLTEDSEFVHMTEEHQQVILRRTSRGKEFIPAIEKTIAGRLDRFYGKKNPTFAFYPYLQAEDEVLQRVLRVAWRQARFPFYEADAVKRNVDDEMPRGLKDLFRIYALLETDSDRNWNVKAAHNAAAAEQAQTVLESHVEEAKIDEICQSDMSVFIAALEEHQQQDGLSADMERELERLRAYHANFLKSQRLHHTSVVLGRALTPRAITVSAGTAGVVGSLVPGGPLLSMTSGIVAAGITGFIGYKMPNIEKTALNWLRQRGTV